MWLLFVEVNRKVWKWRHSVKMGILCWFEIKCRSKMSKSVCSEHGRINKRGIQRAKAGWKSWLEWIKNDLCQEFCRNWPVLSGGKNITSKSPILKHICSLVGGVREDDLDVWKCFVLRKTEIKSSLQNSRHMWFKS